MAYADTPIGPKRFSPIEMQSIDLEHYEPQDKDAFLRFHGLESDRLAGSHERKGALSYLGITDYNLSPETKFALRTNTRPSPYFGMNADAIRRLAHDRHVSMMKDIDELTDNDMGTMKQSNGLGKFIESRRTLTEASEMLGLGTTEYTEHLKNYWVNPKSGRMHVGDVVDTIRLGTVRDRDAQYIFTIGLNTNARHEDNAVEPKVRMI